MLWYSTPPWTATPFSNDLLWLTLFMEGVNVRLLDHCQVNRVPHYCGFKEQEIPRIYTVGMVINWNSNVNNLIFWDTDFWLSWAVISYPQNIYIYFFKCFTLHVMNLKYMKVSLFEISYKKKLTLSRHSNVLRCTCILSVRCVQTFMCFLYHWRLLARAGRFSAARGARGACGSCGSLLFWEGIIQHIRTCCVLLINDLWTKLN